MAKYKVYFSGFAYIEADSEEEAEEIFWDDPSGDYQEYGIDSVEEVDEFLVAI